MATRNDVAKRSGYSTATVSRVLNNVGTVDARIREQVLKAAEELSYRPNMMARGLKKNKSYNIAYIIPDITNPYYTEIYGAINKVCALSGYLCSLITMNKEDQHPMLLSQRFDGIISAVDLPEEMVRWFHDTGVVMLIQSENIQKFVHSPCVTISHNLEEVLMEAFEYMIEHGHSTIGLIIRETRSGMMHVAYQKVMRKHRIPYQKSLVIEYGDADFNYISGARSMNQLLKSHPELTAVAAENDLLAIGAMSEAVRAGLRIPEDVSFLGCDDIVAAQYCIPALSTVKRFKHRQGELAAAMILAMMEGNEVPSHQYKSKFVLRDSISTSKFISGSTLRP